MFYDLNSDDCGPCGTKAVLNFNSTRGYVPGNSYILGIKGFSSSNGSYYININCNYSSSPTWEPTYRPTYRPSYTQYDSTTTYKPTYTPYDSTTTYRPTYRPTFWEPPTTTYIPTYKPAATERPTYWPTIISPTKTPTRGVIVMAFIPHENTEMDLYIFMAYGGIAFVSILLTLFAIWHSACGCYCCRIGDNDNKFLFIGTGLRVYDLLSDIVVAIKIVEFYFEFHGKNKDIINVPNEQDIDLETYDTLLLCLAIGSVFFIIVPYFVNITIGTCMTPKDSVYLNQTFVERWFQYHSFTYMSLVFLTGDAYHSLEIINSNFLGISLFDAGMTKIDIDRKSAIKLGSITILEDIPQAIISICFTVVQVTLGLSVDKLVLSSVIISVLHMIICGLTLAACVIGKRAVTNTVYEVELKMKTQANGIELDLQEQYSHLKKYKGNKRQLKKALLDMNELDVHKRNTHIGYIAIDKVGGCRIFIYHTNEDSKDELQNRYIKNQNKILAFLRDDMFQLPMKSVYIETVGVRNADRDSKIKKNNEFKKPLLSQQQLQSVGQQQLISMNASVGQQQPMMMQQMNMQPMNVQPMVPQMHYANYPNYHNNNNNNNNSNNINPSANYGINPGYESGHTYTENDLSLLNDDDNIEGERYKSISEMANIKTNIPGEQNDPHNYNV